MSAHRTPTRGRRGLLTGPGPSWRSVGDTSRMAMDSISILENGLRDLVGKVLRNRHRDAWEDHLGVTPERLERWRDRREVEGRRRTGAAIEQRLLYYADFPDLLDIIRKNWDPDFKLCF